MKEHHDFAVETYAVVEPTPLPVAAERRVIAVVGIDRYQDVGVLPLHNAVNDAKAVLALFLQLGFAEVVAPLFDEAATGRALNRLVEDDLASKLTPDDQLVLFYAGHGVTHTKTPGGEKVVEGYLVPSDAADLLATRIKLADWIRHISQLPARHILVILDACFAGSAFRQVTERDRDVRTTLTEPLDDLHGRRSRQLITSTRDNEAAADSGPDREHSRFTGCLLKGLAEGVKGLGEGGVATHRHNGRRVTTGFDIAHYLRRSLRAAPDAERAGPRQTPDFGYLAYDNRGEMLIPLGEDLRADRHRELVRSGQLASPRVASLLAGRLDQFPAIDDAVVLSEIPRSSQPGELVIHVDRPRSESDSHAWTRADLEAALDGRSWDPRAIAYMRSRLPDGVDHDVSGMKLGLVRIVRAAPNHDQPLTLALEAWPWWVEREFNRRLLRAAPHSPDDELARSLATRLLGEDNDAGSYQLAFPSGFYIEVAVVDDAANVLLLTKAARSGSHMATAGMKWTCTTEEGVKLSDASRGRLDPWQVALRGLREELGIAEHDIGAIDFGMVALQSRHLNTALLGVATVREPCAALARRVIEGKCHDFSGARVVALGSAYDEFDGEAAAQRSGSWHATARLRLHLAMVRHNLA